MHALSLAIALVPLANGVHAVRDVTVVDVERGEALPHRTVLVEGERITAVGLAEEVDVPTDAVVIEGAGHWLMPGLSDMHVHYFHPESYGPLFVANGVTLVRDTGAFTASILALRARLSSGEILGPELVCTGAIVDGARPIWPFSEACATPEDGLRAVEKLALAGVDQIKVYSGLEPDVFRVVVEEAHRRGLRVTGHIPNAVPLDLALEVGMDCNEHLMGFGKTLHALAHEPSELTGFALLDLDMGGGWLALDLVPDERLERLCAQVVEAGMIQSPTLVVMDRIARLNDPALRSDPLLEYVPDFLESMWTPERDFRFQDMDEEDYALQRDANERARALLLRLWKAGVSIVSGTDLTNPYLVAGFSLHDELELYQAAGLPPAAVLRTTTLAAAKLASRGDLLGTVERGKVASLVLLSADPLADVANTRAIEGVFLRGRWFDRTALDLLLDRARAAAGSPPRAPDDTDAER